MQRRKPKTKSVRQLYQTLLKPKPCRRKTCSDDGVVSYQWDGKTEYACPSHIRKEIHVSPIRRLSF